MLAENEEARIEFEKNQKLKVSSFTNKKTPLIIIIVSLIIIIVISILEKKKM